MLEMKILAIGNSFSQNTTDYLNKISKELGQEIEVVNMYIAACSLKTHAKNIKEDNRDYDYQYNGAYIKKSSLSEVLQENFDIITVQQYSGDSGDLSTLEPYLKEILDYIKVKSVTSKIYYHKTWSYEKDSPHQDFKKYKNSQILMEQSINDVSQYVYEQYGIESIPMMEAVKCYRENKKLKLTPLSLDGHHLNTEAGKTLGALVWFCFLTNYQYDATSKITSTMEIDIDELIRLASSVVSQDLK